MRKNIDVNEALLSHSLMNRKIMNDIMYYLRRLIKLAKRAQTLSLKEGKEYDDPINDILEEMKDIREGIEKIEKVLEEK